MRRGGADRDRVAGFGRAGHGERDSATTRSGEPRSRVRVLERPRGRHRRDRPRAVVAGDADAGDRHRVTDLEGVRAPGRDRDSVAVLLGAAERGGARRGVDREAQRLDRSGGRVARAEGDNLDLIAAAEVPQRGRLHLIDRGLV